MRVNSVLLLSFYVYAMAQNGVEVGNAAQGAMIILSTPARECEPLRLFYNISTLPASGATISFLTPDDQKDEWMELRPPIGVGMLSWTCTLPAGSQFVVRNYHNYEEVFSVEQGGSGTQCRQQTATVTTDFAYGALNPGVYQTLTAHSYDPTSITPPAQFLPVNMPVGMFNVISVPLGSPMDGPTNTASPPPSSTSPPSDPQTQTETQGNVPGDTNSVHTSATGPVESAGLGINSGPNVGGGTVSFITISGEAVTVATVSTPDAAFSRTVLEGSSIAVGTSSIGSPFTSQEPSAISGTPRTKGRAIIGIVLGVALLGMLGTAAGVIAYRRRRRASMRDRVRPIPPVPPVSSSSVSENEATPPKYMHMDSKVALSIASTASYSTRASVPSPISPTYTASTRGFLLSPVTLADGEEATLYSPPRYSA